MQAKGKWRMVVMSAALTGAVAAAPLGAGAQSIDKPLHKGMKDSDVKPVQKQLKELDYYSDQVDGAYGSNTLKAVNEFQSDYDINEDGIFGSDTSNKLEKVDSLQKKFKKAPLLRQGDEGKKVKALQTQLQRLKYYKGNPDGIFGPNTETSTRDFQNANDIAVDGIAGPDTYKALTHNPETANEEKPQEAKKDNSGKEEKKSSDSNKSTHQSQAKKSSGDNKDNAKKASTNSSDKKGGKSITVKSTAYSANCSGCSGVTATGVNLKKNPGKKVIAVDPDVIPLGSTVQVPGYGKAVAADTGGAINGKRIDVFVPGKKKANNYGMKTVTVKVLD